MTDTFVPLISAINKPGENNFTAINLKASAKSASASALSSPAPAHTAETCAKPTVTLQRNGDVVTSIRVQCGCGEVIELSCVY